MALKTGVLGSVMAGVLGLFGGASCRADVAMVTAKLKAGAKVVDVRTPGEFKSGHYPGAVNIPLHELDDRLAEFGDKEKPIVVYCRSGNRSGQAKRQLEAAGYRDVTNGGGLRDMPKR
jgi:phage shock protein E